MVGCSNVIPPKEFSPQAEVIKKALYSQLNQKYNSITTNLQTSPPKITITQININQIDPFWRDDLPVYHLRGNYQFKLKSRNKQFLSKYQIFDLYLQRQKEGKTWRLLKK